MVCPVRATVSIIPGYFIGGPVLLPGTNFNRNRDKLFFFWSQDFLPLTIPSSVQTQTFPTALERQGDFSKSGVTVTSIRSRARRLPGNMVPASRIDPNGQKLLSLFPLPNTIGPGGQYNWAGVSINKQPRRDSVLRTRLQISSEHDVLCSSDSGLPGIARAAINFSRRWAAAIIGRSFPSAMRSTAPAWSLPCFILSARQR